MADDVSHHLREFAVRFGKYGDDGRKAQGDFRVKAGGFSLEGGKAAGDVVGSQAVELPHVQAAPKEIAVFALQNAAGEVDEEVSRASVVHAVLKDGHGGMVGGKGLDGL